MNRVRERVIQKGFGISILEMDLCIFSKDLVEKQ